MIIMSRLAFRSPSNSPDITIDAPQKIKRHHIILEATPKPLSANKYNKDSVAIQSSTLEQLHTTGKDLFEKNETRKIQSGGVLLYQTEETYGTSLSIERTVEFLDQANLTLRVNFNRPGAHSSTTCMSLTSKVLKNLVATAADGNGHKIAELRIKDEKTAENPIHGQMYVAITKKGTQHYLSHIDYKIMASYDAMYHRS